MRSAEKWKKINNANIVAFVQTFTTGDFGSNDRSLVYVTEFHPCSKTLEETHFAVKQNGYRSPGKVDREVLWGYLVQLCSALKTIHDNKCAARLIDASKILVTSKNRIRLNVCGLLDIVQSDSPKTLPELQNDDLVNLGLLILTLGTSPAAVQTAPAKATDTFERTYGSPFTAIVGWLLQRRAEPQTGTIDDLVNGIGSQIMTDFNASLNLVDELEANLNRELENSRISRLMIKLNFINERPEYLGNPQWSETGERYPIKLFRDYVFHQVDADGYPVLDLAHVLSCMNKLDAGIEEKMVLTTRDDQTVIVVSFKEMKRAVNRAYDDLVSASKRKAGY